MKLLRARRVNTALAKAKRIKFIRRPLREKKDTKNIQFTFSQFNYTITRRTINIYWLRRKMRERKAETWESPRVMSPFGWLKAY